MHALTFLQDLAVVMIVAGLVTLIFHRLKQPVVLGYILAGAIIGPHTPPFPLIHDLHTIQTLAELGIIFLMFSLGLEFNLRKLTQVGLPAFVAAILEIGVMGIVGYMLGQTFGWSVMDSVFLGAMLAMSSTTVIIKVLGDLGMMRERFAGLIFGILIIEDVLAIVMIALLSGIAMTGSLEWMDVGRTVGRLGIFLVTALVTGLILVPRLLNYVARFKSDEMLLITVLALCFGSSLLAVKLDYSVALGAFVIGAVIAESREFPRIVHLTEPLRDMFSAVFFVAVGMLIDPNVLRDHAGAVAAITVAVVVVKVASCGLGCFLAGTDARTSMRVGMGLAQIGEFSFIIAALGVTLGVTSHFLYPIAVAVSAVTTLFTPYLIRSADGVASWCGRSAPRPVLGTVGLYTRWISDLRRTFPKRPELWPLRSLCGQIAVNLTLIAGLFVAAAFASRVAQDMLPLAGSLPGGARTACWMAAVVLALPIYVATFRKLQALAMMLAEVSIVRPVAGVDVQRLRKLLVHAVVLVATVGLGLLTVLFSSAILPPRHALLALLVVVALLVIFFGATFNRLYTTAKFALVDTWSAAPEPPSEPAKPLPALLKAATMDVVVVGQGGMSGKRVRETMLRAQTGVSIVAIERAGQTIVNPGPDEELLSGDQVLLLGSKEQLAEARRRFG